VSQADVDINDQIVNVQNNKETLYEVGKILRKQYTSGKWFYRVKWLNFDSKNNSWVKYKDLNNVYPHLLVTPHFCSEVSLVSKLKGTSSSPKIASSVASTFGGGSGSGVCLDIKTHV
jgi:hypothetical protein